MYQVWVKEEFGETWKKEDCETPPAKSETKVETREKPGAKKEKAIEAEKDTT